MLYANSYSQTTPILDSNFEHALVHMNIDTNGVNGNILDSDAQSVTSLNIFGKNIQDLTGIQAFTNLRHLNADFNDLITVDLSQNSELEYVDLENNKLISIDVSHNLELEELYISSNVISTLDVSANHNLEILACSINNISVLDVSHNLELETLWCYSNDLSSLTVTNNDELKSLICGQNNLGTINVSHNLELETLSCASANLSQLVIENNPALKYLDCSNNAISTLDLSSNHSLKRILSSNNTLSDLDVSDLEDLFLFYVANNSLTSIDLSNNPDLKYFNAENNDLSSIDIRNGNNNIIREFNVTQNTNLSCAFVDDTSESYLETWDVDDHCNFVHDENECELLSTTDTFTVSDFKIYPNPASDSVTITLSNTDAVLELYTFKGQLVHKQQLLSGRNQVNIAHMSSGIYLAKVMSDNFTKTTKLVIK